MRAVYYTIILMLLASATTVLTPAGQAAKANPGEAVGPFVFHDGVYDDRGVLLGTTEEVRVGDWQIQAGATPGSALEGTTFLKITWNGLTGTGDSGAQICIQTPTQSFQGPWGQPGALAADANNNNAFYENIEFSIHGTQLGGPGQQVASLMAYDTGGAQCFSFSDGLATTDAGDYWVTANLLNPRGWPVQDGASTPYEFEIEVLLCC